MTPIEKPDLLQRLVDEPYDSAALCDLYALLGDEPEPYAKLLETAAEQCADRTAASHYLTEAGRTYLEALHDVPEGCRLIGRAVDLDPLNGRAADLLASTVADALRGADYGGLLKRRAEVLERLARHDRSLLLSAVEAWERYAENIVRAGAPPEEAIQAMARALDLMRGSVRPSSRPPPARRDTTDTLEPPPESRPRDRNPRDTVHTPKPESAMLPGSGRRREMDSAPTLPRGETLPPEPAPTDPTALGASLLTSPTIRSPRPPDPPADASPEGERRRPDRLIALFEALRGVDECSTVEAAARFLLDVARRSVGARFGLIHVLDPSTDEYVVTAVSGACDRSLIGARIPTSDPLLGDAIGRAHSVVADAGSHWVLSGERWTSNRPKRCVLCAPALLDELPLGALELVDPLDRGRFDREDEHVAIYVAERWAEILSEHGRA
jgi:hypothetical protein